MDTHIKYLSSIIEFIKKVRVFKTSLGHLINIWNKLDRINSKSPNFLKLERCLTFKIIDVFKKFTAILIALASVIAILMVESV